MAPIDPIEFGRVLARLDAQDIELRDVKNALRDANNNIATLLALANRGKGSLMMLCLFGSIIGWVAGSSVVSSVVGWVAGHWPLK